MGFQHVASSKKLEAKTISSVGEIIGSYLGS
jgi:hypothetical protein